MRLRRLLPPLALAALISSAALQPSHACTTALVLAIDVSNSIDPAEYRIQAEGLADALLDPEIQETLVAGQVALAVIQWSGGTRQEVSIPWQRMQSPADVLAFSNQARAMERAFVMSDTALGELMNFAVGQFGPVSDCSRHVIDISGDGAANAGSDPKEARRNAERNNIQINGLAIEGLGLAITSYYRGYVITRNGFVMTATGHGSYAETLRRKILREVSAALF